MAIIFSFSLVVLKDDWAQPGDSVRVSHGVGMDGAGGHLKIPQPQVGV